MTTKKQKAPDLNAAINNPQLHLSQTIDKLKINKTYLAEKMNMPVGTFKNKLNPNQASYKFTRDEYNKLLKVVQELATELQTAVYSASYWTEK